MDAEEWTPADELEAERGGPDWEGAFVIYVSMTLC